MLGNLKGLATTLREFFKPVVTAQYPKEHLPIAPRFMGFPALTWDQAVGDNPLFKEDKSKRRKIVGDFEINLGRCILCGICVDVCNFDAIEMSHEHELSVFERNGNRATKERLLEMGWDYQQKSGWRPAKEAEEAGEEASA